MDNSEQVLKEFIRKPENKKCFICGSNAPQYFVMDFQTVVCTSCSSVHLEFGHHVKNVSLASFTPDEVKKLLSGGNKKMAMKYLASYNPKRYPRPEPNNRVAIHHFIQKCFIDKIWMTEQSSSSVNHQKRSSVSREQPTHLQRKLTNEDRPTRLEKQLSFREDSQNESTRLKKKLTNEELPTTLQKTVSLSNSSTQATSSSSNQMDDESLLFGFDFNPQPVSQPTQTSEADSIDALRSLAPQYQYPPMYQNYYAYSSLPQGYYGYYPHL